MTDGMRSLSGAGLRSRDALRMGTMASVLLLAACHHAATNPAAASAVDEQQLNAAAATLDNAANATEPQP